MHWVRAGLWKNAGFAFFQQNEWVGVVGDWHSDDSFRTLMPTSGSGNGSWSPLYYVHRKGKVPPLSLDNFYGSSPTGTLDQPTSNSFAPLWKKTVSSPQWEPSQRNQSNSHEVIRGQLSTRLCDREYKGHRSTEEGGQWAREVGVMGCQEAFMENVGCGEWKKKI